MKNNKKNKCHSMAATVTGAIIGAGVVATGAAVMSNRKNQQKVKQIASDIKKQAQEKKVQVEKNIKKIKTILKKPKKK